VDDLVSEAVIGLQMAIPRFKQNYKNKLSTYAGFWMRQRVMRYIDNQKSVIRVPVHRSAQARKLMRVVADMAITLGREPTHEEVSEITGIPLKSIERAFAVQRPVMSLDAPVGDSEGGECSLGEIIPDDSVVSADTDLTNENDVDLVMEIVRKLPAREQAIFRRRCGFGRGGVPETLESIAKSFKITRERVRQLQNSTIEEIRKRVAQRNSPNYRDIHSLLAA
jgi:RNA polymerase primary sigma factor